MKRMALRNYIFMLKNRKFQLIIGILFILFALSIDVHAVKATVSFPYDSASVREIDFNQFEVTFNSSSGYTPAQINNAIEVSGEKSNNIKIKNIIKDGNTYIIYGGLSDYSIRYNKLFNPWLNSSWENRSVYNISNPKQFFPVNITTGYNKSDRWINCSDNTPLPYWNETSNNKVWVNLTVNTSQICKYVNSTDAYIGNENGNATFAFFDDFGETGIDTTKWTVTKDSPENVILINGFVRVWGNSGWNTNGLVETKDLLKPYNIHYTEGVDVNTGYALSALCGASLCDPNVNGFDNYFSTTREHLILNTTDKIGIGDLFTPGINYSNRISIKNTGWRWYKNQTLRIDNNTDVVNFNRFQSQVHSVDKLYVDNVFSYPYYDPEPKATLWENQSIINITSWGNNYTNNESLNISAQGTGITINFTINTTDNPDTFQWLLNDVSTGANLNYTNILFNTNGTYHINVTASYSGSGSNSSKNWTVYYTQNSTGAIIFITSNITSNCGLNIHLNLTNLAVTLHADHPGTGERLNDTIYYANDSAIQLNVFAHASSVSQTASVFVYFNGTLISARSGRPLGGAEEAYRGVDIMVPRDTWYKVVFVNTHHQEWRESKIDLDISGCNYPSNNTSLNNTIYNISSPLALLFSIIALAICLKKKKK